MPRFDEENVPKGQMTHIIQVAKIFINKYNLSKWKDRHDLVYEPIRKYSRWFCNQCRTKLKFSELDSACTGVSQRTTNTECRKRKQLCSDWWGQAKKKSLTRKERNTQQLMKQQSFIKRQRLAWTNQPKEISSSTAMGIPLAPRTEPEVWWKCPYCDFKVQNGANKRPHAQRLYHLNRAHGIKGKQAHLMRPNDRSHPHRPVALMQSVKTRWEKQLQEFKKLRWPGAHDLNSEPARTQVTNGKSRQWVRSYYECKACLDLVPSSAVPTDTCYATNGKGPSLEKRKQIWKQCRDVASLTTTKWLQDKSKIGFKKRKTKPTRKACQQLSQQAAGMTASRNGLRGQVIGEAANPGPIASLKVWSQNISSFQLHGRDLLERAEKADVHLLALQETNISTISTASTSHMSQRMGWQMMQIPKPGKNQGGVALLCREPLGLVLKKSETTPQGRFTVHKEWLQ